MSGKPNGSKPIQRLAAALRPPPTEELAAALQECLDSAVERGAQATREDMAEVKETLRMIWKQCGGSPKRRLPIDGRTDR